MKHMPVGRVLVSPDDNLALTLRENLPAEGLRPEPGPARQVVSVNDDVMESDRHAVSMRGHATMHPANPPASREPAVDVEPLNR